MKFISISLAVGLSSQVLALPISLDAPLAAVGQLAGNVETLAGSLPVVGSLGLKRRDVGSTVQGVESFAEGALSNPLGLVGEAVAPVKAVAGSAVQGVESLAEGALSNPLGLVGEAAAPVTALAAPVTGALGLKRDVVSTVQGVQTEITSVLTTVQSLKDDVEAGLDSLRMASKSHSLTTIN